MKGTDVSAMKRTPRPTLIGNDTEFTPGRPAAGPSQAGVPVLADADAATDEAQLRSERRNAAQPLLQAILRMEALVDEEISALKSLKKVDYDGFSRRKNRSLLELVRSSKVVAGSGRDVQIADEVARLRAKLDKNRALLLLHFDAVRSVAEIICKSLRESESDGTYAATSRARK
jgi:hypothetical protein